MSTTAESFSAPGTLYHYCSTNTFYSIISNNSIRLSSMSLSNDAMEGRMALRAFEELSKDYSVAEGYQAVIPLFLNEINERYDGLAMCLSEAGDLLSQWRGYADDGQGFCIGFSTAYLNAIGQPQDWVEFFSNPVKLQRVLYLPDQHKNEVRNTFLRMQAYVDRLARNDSHKSLANEVREQLVREKITQSLFANASELVNSLFVLKSNAFSEEREWRLLSTVDSESHVTGDFRPTACNLIPYQTLKLGVRSMNPITEIIIGPKNTTPIPVLKSFLNKHKHLDVEIRQSSATYR